MTVELRDICFPAQVGVRCDPEAAATLGLPTQPNTVAVHSDRRALWLGPDEWLVCGGEGDEASIEAKLTASLADEAAAVVDLSSNRRVLELTGAAASEVLATGCALDLDRLVPGACAQTLLARAQVILDVIDDAPTYRIHVRPSFTPYLTAWLRDAMAEHLET